MNTPFKTVFFRAILVLFGAVALIGSSVAPALAERDEPGLPLDLRAYCEFIGHDTAIIHPQDLRDPSGKSWRCADVKWTGSDSSNSGCEVSAGIEVEVDVKTKPSGNIQVTCSWSDGRVVEYEIIDMWSIDLYEACAIQHGYYDAGTDSYVTWYEADSYDWSDPFALGCYSTVEF